MEDRCIEWGENNGASRQCSGVWWGWKIDVSNGEKTMDPRVNARGSGGDGRSMYRMGEKTMGEWLDLLGTTGDVVGQDGGDVYDCLAVAFFAFDVGSLWDADEAAMLNVPLLAIDIMYLAIA